MVDKETSAPKELQVMLAELEKSMIQLNFRLSNVLEVQQAYADNLERIMSHVFKGDELEDDE